MSYKSVYFLFAIILTIHGCKPNIHEKEEIITIINTPPKVDKDPNKVIIKGVADDTIALRYITLLNDAYLFGKNYHKTKRTLKKDSIYIEVDSIFSPQAFNFGASGSSKFYLTKIILYPGDTLSFKISDKELHFYGKNATYNNFFTLLDKNTTPYKHCSYNGDINDYKKRLTAFYNQKLIYLNKYASQHVFSSEEQIYLIKDILKFNYLSLLINPLSEYVKDNDRFIQSSEGVISLMNNDDLIHQEKLFDLNDYFNGITLADFKRPDLLDNSHIYKDCLDAFIRYYFANNDYLKYSGEAFLAQKEFIQENFDGKLAHYAIARMISEYTERGFGYSVENIKILKNTMREYEPIFSSKPSYKEKMDEIKASLTNFNFKLPDLALNFTKLINPNGDTITLKQIFDDSPKKIRIIDFWASWCPPCIREIKKATHFRNKLARDNNVEWIYLSIDTEKNKWLKKTKELQEYIITNNQYIIVGGKNSSLGNALKISGIPRYVILDKNERIVLDNAPKPSDSTLFKKIIDQLNGAE